MRTFVRIRESYGSISSEVWTGDTWKNIDASTFNWESFRVPYAEEPTRDGEGIFILRRPLRFSSRQPKPEGIEVFCMTASASLLPAIAECLPALVGDEPCSIELNLSEGIWFDTMTSEDLVAFGRNGVLNENLFASADSHHDRLQSIVSDLHSVPHAELLKVFGSTAAGKELPSDIDVYADTGTLTKPEIEDLSVRLMQLAKRHYGYLDPFLLISGTLYCRNDTATGWIVARYAKEIQSSGDHGIPLVDVVLKECVLDQYRGVRPAKEIDYPSPRQ